MPSKLRNTRSLLSAPVKPSGRVNEVRYQKSSAKGTWSTLKIFVPKFGSAIFPALTKLMKLVEGTDAAIQVESLNPGDESLSPSGCP